MVGTTKRAVRTGLAVLAGFVLAAPTMAQNVGDVGRDRNGNLFTYTLDANGNGVWTPGRVGTPGQQRTVLGERYSPGIWVDPDGCQHWVMDDGTEGFMTPRMRPNGRPVCDRSAARGRN